MRELTGQGALNPQRSSLGDVALRGIGAVAEEVLAHLLLQILARLRVHEVQAILVYQHLLVLEPRLPRLLRDALPEPLAELAGVRRIVEALGLLLQLDAVHGSSHQNSFTKTFDLRS